MQTYLVTVQWRQEEKALVEADQLEKNDQKEIVAITKQKVNLKYGPLLMLVAGWCSAEREDLRNSI